jgi:hypothetical protein
VIARLTITELDHWSIELADHTHARRLIAGIETMPMVKKGQLDGPKGEALSAADQFYSLAI